MEYSGQVVPGRFLARPNRFIAQVEIFGQVETCHVKNTGRCRELLVPGAEVYLEDRGGSPGRKTRYDLVAVRKGERLINMDSQAPNQAVLEWLRAGHLFGENCTVRPEYRMGNSRFDFGIFRPEGTAYLEVKGVTLEQSGVCLFPDAPTIRGARHLAELGELAAAGGDCTVLFVIQMEGVRCFLPNREMDPVFARNLEQAQAQGVRILAWDCSVTPESMTLRASVPVCLGETGERIFQNQWKARGNS
jgi:sugar fermentation stimulation protein A